MSKFTKADIIDEKGRSILKSALDPNYFYVTDYADVCGKDRYPDIDGQIRLRDGKNNYLNKYLHFQLKSTENLVDQKYRCENKVIEYLCSTNIPTLLFVVDINEEKVYWQFYKNKTKKGFNSDKGKKSKIIDLKNHEVSNNLLELHQKWQEYAKKDNYIEVKSSLNSIVASFNENIENCIGLLYLLGRINKDKCPKLFNSILNIEINEVITIINNLSGAGVITATANLYLVENEQLGIELLYKLIEGIDLNALETSINDFNDKKIIIKQLAKIKHTIVHGYLNDQVNKCLRNIKSATNNDEIFEHLEMLEVYAHRVSKDTINIIKSLVNIEKVLLPTTRHYEGYGDIEGKSYQDILIKSIEILNNLRYIELEDVYILLIKLSQQTNSEIQTKSITGLKNIAEYNIFALQKIGYRAQTFIVDNVSKWSEEEIITNNSVFAAICKKLLVPSFEGLSMDDYRTFTIHSGALNASDTLMQIRQETIRSLQRAYIIDTSLEKKKKVLETLREVSRTSHNGSYTLEAEKMVLADVNSLIEFYISIVYKAENEIVKEIEEQTYWFVRRFGKEKLPRLYELQSTIASKEGYDVFRIFVGYSRGFSEDLDWEKVDELRKNKINEFVDDISNKNFEEWQQKILTVLKNYSPTQYGEYQYFNKFLYELGKQKPESASKFVEGNEPQLNDFIVFLITGIWNSNLKSIAQRMISQRIRNNKNLYESVLVFEKSDEVDIELLNTIFEKAKESKDIRTLNAIVRLIARNYSRYRDLKRMYINAIKELTDNGSYTWINDAWCYSSSICKALTKSDINIIINNLLLIEDVNYDAEEILAIIAENYPDTVINYFSARVTKEFNKDKNERYEAAPFSLYKLNDVLIMKSEVIVPMILRWFTKKEWMYQWYASKLLKAIFPQFNQTLEIELLKLVGEGRKRSIEAVLKVLREYEGESFLHNVCKEIIKQYPNNKEYKQEMFFVLSQMGVVSGEYGYVSEYKQKVQLIQSWKHDESKEVQLFCQAYEEYLNKQIEFEKKRADEHIELMKRNLRF